ncbi:MAG: hypothetical protein KDA60_07785 [Planctomycetales bacterium]|nr:hypothetical protein [Planctomycetales bacterium]
MLFAHVQTVAANRATVQALVGDPINVGKVTLLLESNTDLLAAATGAIRVSDRDGRLLYPAVSDNRIAKILELLAAASPPSPTQRLDIYFLFTGEEPLTLDIRGLEAPTIEVTVSPLERPGLHRRLLTRWWREYRRNRRIQEAQGDYPPIVETYLTQMLGQRFGRVLPPPGPSRLRTQPARETVDLIFGAEQLAQHTMTQVVAGQVDHEVAATPLPEPIIWHSPDDTPPETRPDVEPLAHVVPSDCFYVRFGKFSHLLWLDKLTAEAGGDLSRLVRLRGYQTGASDRLRAQLGIEELPFAELLGDKVIADVALIGRDLFVNHGAAVGVILQEAAPVVGPGLDQLRFL